MSLLLITHDLAVVAENAQTVMVMYAGRIVENAAVRDLFARPAHPYTRGLLESIPTPGGPARRRLRAIEGIVPDLRTLAPGCRFADRCPMRVELCTQQEPDLLPVGPNHSSRCWRSAEVSP
jgi:oligopeptide/dipeptide ABC transporter ATP-binding protein